MRLERSIGALRTEPLAHLGGIASYLPLTSSLLLLFAGYYVGAKLGLALTFHPFPISVLWPPNAILLAALLVTPFRWWPALVFAAFPAHLLAELQDGVPTVMVLCWFVSNVSEALIGAVCVRRLLPRGLEFDSFRSVAVFIAFAAVLAPFLSSFLDAAFVTAVGWGASDYWQLVRTRFFSNVLATLTLVPVVVTWTTGGLASLQAYRPARFFEAAVLMLGLLAAGVFVFDLPLAGSGVPPALLYLPLPFLLWAGLRFGTTGASTAFMLIALLVIWGAGHGRGPFAVSAPLENAQSVQYFLIFVGITVLALAAVVQERRTAEQRLRRSEERFATAFRASPDAMAISRKADGRLIEVNDRWLAMFGHRREDAIGQAVTDFRFYADEKERARLFELVEKQGRAHDLEMSFRASGGDTVRALLSTEAVEMGGEPCFITIIRDITDRKRAEEANARLAHFSRLAVVGELTASIAHEINQPLGAILSNADAAELLLRSDEPRLDELRLIIEDIRNDDIRAGEVIRHMRSLMRRRELSLEPFDLNRAISDVLHLVNADLTRHRVSVETAFAPLPIVYGDQVHLQQVVLNLILNAVDAMGALPSTQRRLKIETARPEAGGVEFNVADNGLGIPTEQMEQLFQSFFTTKRDGMGLGLAIARSIAEAHGGRIWAENRPGGGAIFRVRLPARDRRQSERGSYQVSERGTL